MKIPTIAAILGLATLASAEVFLHETFSDGEGWKDRWTLSTHREDLGTLEVSSGKWAADEEKSAGLRTTEDYRFYAASTKFKKFNNKKKDLIIQFDVKNEQNIDCGGSYLKFFSDKFDAKTFNGDSEYNIMFGPDICGSKAIVHAILNYKGVNYDLRKTIQAPKDVFTHTYTLVVKPDQTYQVLIDGEEQAAGSLLEDWSFLPPKTIKDPDAKKPEDWVDDAKMDDPTDVKPEGWDDIPEFVADPEVTKPADWDDDMDGEWEAPSVPNPEFKGAWTAKRIDNPDFKGEWVHPEIDNPDYKVDKSIYAYDFANVGLDVWQVKSGTIFNNILVTDDEKKAEEVRKASRDLAEKEFDSKAAYEEKENKKDGETEEEDKGEDAPAIDLDEGFNIEVDEKKTPVKDEL